MKKVLSSIESPWQTATRIVDNRLRARKFHLLELGPERSKKIRNKLMADLPGELWAIVYALPSEPSPALAEEKRKIEQLIALIVERNNGGTKEENIYRFMELPIPESVRGRYNRPTITSLEIALSIH